MRAQAVSKSSAWSKHGLPWLLPAVIVVVWQLLGELGFMSDRILPTPLSIGRAGWSLAESGVLFQYIGTSTQRALIGLVIGGAVGLFFGFLNGMIPVSEKLTDTSMQMLRTVPHLSLIPLVILWFGIGDEGKIFLVALGTVFPVYLNTLHGIRSVDPGLIEMGRTYGLNGWQLFRNVILPGALPSILVGVRFALGIMWLSLIVAETISADSGIGYMAMNAREFFQMDVVVLSIILYALLGKLSDWLARWMERSWLKWHPHFRQGR
ncbi:aliphatic sulfonate ABC transporter permease SsuC [Paenibacillus sp. R14(2021)]|uniref:aliphatic sulfonate ABC transporter permease SsuC n=1 Tax=Paenibacillus sp. R14(2021) TaxID=2859228 RepID=UPI001C616A60|nr:aliphatic sulfonate ABC transporter permease SsuC [Paenibacillus sp. R14(2021)]